MNPQKVTFLLAALVAVAPLSSARAEPAPSFREDADKLVIENGAVTVWLQGKKPLLKVFPTVAPGKGYAVELRRVVEYRDFDGNGLPSAAEARAELDLQKATWTALHASSEDSVHLNLTTAGPVRLLAPGPADPGLLPVSPPLVANLSLLFHLHAREIAIEAAGSTLLLPTSALKHDFVLSSWPWIDAANGRLALEILVEPETAEIADAGAVDVLADGEAVGRLAWPSTASAWKEGKAFEAAVKTSAAPRAENETTSLLVFTFDGAGYSRLRWEPTLSVATVPSAVEEPDAGVLESLKRTPAPAFALAAIAAASAALLARRR